jgi:hypothetical protein
LAHAGIDDRNAGFATLPAHDRFGIVRGPREAIELRVEIAFRRLRKVVQQVMREIAPAQFAQERFGRCGALAGSAVAREILERSHDLPRPDLAEMQMWRKARCAIAVGTVATIRVVRQRVFAKAVQQSVRAALAGLPGRAEPAVPGNSRQQLQCLDPDGARQRQ